MTRPIDRLLGIMARLRDPERGCPWDREQDFATIAPYTIEEAYEVADAIERQDMAALQDELGDLLLQVVFHARMAEEAGLFGFDDVVQAIAEKMVRPSEPRNGLTTSWRPISAIAAPPVTSTSRRLARYAGEAARQRRISSATVSTTIVSALAAAAAEISHCALLLSTIVKALAGQSVQPGWPDATTRYAAGNPTAAA